MRFQNRHCTQHRHLEVLVENSVVFGCSDGFGQPCPAPNPSYVEEFWSDANGLMELWSVDLGRLGIFCGVDVCWDLLSQGFEVEEVNVSVF